MSTTVVVAAVVVVPKLLFIAVPDDWMGRWVGPWVPWSCGTTID